MGCTQRVEHTRLVVVGQHTHSQLQGTGILVLVHRAAKQQSYGFDERYVYLDVDGLAIKRLKRRR